MNLFHITTVTNNSSFDIPYKYLILMHSTAIITVPLHLIAFWCILKKTPVSAKNLADKLFCNIICTFFTEIILSSGTTPILFLPIPGGIPYGLLTYLGLPTVWQLNLVVIIVVLTANTMTHAVFTRYIAIVPDTVLIKKYTSEKFRKFVIASGYIFVVVTGSILVHMLYEDQNMARAKIKELYTCVNPMVDDEQSIVFVMSDFLPQLALLIIVAYMLFIIGLILYLGFFSLYYVKWGVKSTKSTSNKTLAIQQQFQKVLFMQAFVHFVTFAMPIFCFMFYMQMNICWPDLVNITTFIWTLHGSFGAISLMGTTPNYRRDILRKISLSKSRNARTNSVISTLPQLTTRLPEANARLTLGVRPLSAQNNSVRHSVAVLT